jgi:formiminotetrahydrofolate cyclodeaminase
MTEDVVGKHTAEVLTDIQVTAMLAEGGMSISLSHVDDIQQIVYLSEQARHILLQILVP